ncbi:MAG: hypothetical protein J6Y71_04505 [Ruminococcus sp.]|nr:hypothetical protein [Ruminococcus sp.]
MDTKNYFYNSRITGQKQSVMAPSVAAALVSFCEQEPEFEQAVEQSGKTFQDCMDDVAKGIGRSISDLDAYKKAVKFYFSTADIHFHMTIDLCGDIGSPPITMTKADKGALNVSLDDLLGDL